MFRSRSTIVLLSSLVVLLLSLSLAPTFAQDDKIVLTIGLDEFQESFLGDSLFDAFEADHPNVDVVPVIIRDNLTYIQAPTEVAQVSEYMQQISEYAATADVLPIRMDSNPRLLSLTRAWLDLNPFMSADVNADLADFYPPVLESMQWDGATWGLPLSARVIVVAYNKNAFDEQGLAYPSDSWTLGDFINAGTTLTVYDSEDKVLMPGFTDTGATQALFAALLDLDLSDPNAFFSRPAFNRPEIIELVEQWAAFQKDMTVTSEQQVEQNFLETPLTINGTFFFNDSFGIPNDPDSTADMQGALLPNGRAGLQVNAYGVSSGTAHPELAYELVQYLTRNTEFVYSAFSDTPARQSLVNADTSDLPIFVADLSPEVETIVADAMQNAIPQSTSTFYTYINSVVSVVNSPDQSATVEDVISDLEEKALAIFDAVEEQALDVGFDVVQPQPTPVLQSGEVSLNFGIETFGGSDTELWPDVISEFIAQDPQVGQIVLDNDFVDINQRIETQDCFYLRSNVIPNADLSKFYSVGQFLSTDTNLSIDNFVNGTLEQVSREGVAWGLPIAITPQVMWYDVQSFEDAGLPLPSNDWTMSQFVDVLRALQRETGNAPYRTESFGGTYLYQMIAAYGGAPIDYNTTPYTLNTTDPTNIEAIRQVLDLARDGLIDYQNLAGFGGFGNFSTVEPLIFDAELALDDFRLQQRNEPDFEGRETRVVMFPRSIDYIPLAYRLSTGYISANTSAPDACYRWLSFIARRPEVSNGMPAQADLFTTTLAELDNAEDVLSLYQAYDEALRSPSAVIIPDLFNGTTTDPVASVTNFITINWINAAFDKYVKNDADLTTVLEDAQRFAGEFRTCTAGIDLPDTPLSQLEDDEANNFFASYLRCAIDVDESLEATFGPVLTQIEGDDE